MVRLELLITDNPFDLRDDLLFRKHISRKGYRPRRKQETGGSQMQEIKREVLVEKAKELLSNGTVDRVLGWKRDEDPDNNFDWNITPAIFRTAEEIDRDFVWNDFCGANFSKYLIKETIGKDAKVLVFLKPCDTYSFNQLLTEHRFDREKVQSS